MHIKQLTSTNKLKNLLLKSRQFNQQSKDGIKTQQCNNNMNDSNEAKKDFTMKCNSSIMATEKSLRVNENQLYKKILLAEGQKSFNKINSQQKPIQEVVKKQQQTLIHQNHIKPLINLPKNIINQKQSTKQSLKHLNRHTAKEFYQNISLTSQPLDHSSPLEMWKQVQREYNKAKNYSGNVTTGDNINANMKKKPRRWSKNFGLIISEEKKLNVLNKTSGRISNNKVTKVDVKQFIEKFGRKFQDSKRNQTSKCNNENQLQNNIILRKSFSSTSSKPLKTKTHITKLNDKEQHQIPESIKTLTHQHQKSEQSQVVLLHKQPLQDYMHLFFNPLNNLPQRDNQQLGQFVRIKTKKLTQRSIEHLQRIKNNLFKQKTRKQLFNNDDQTHNHSLKYSKKNLLTTTTSAEKKSRRSSILNINNRNKLLHKNIKTQAHPQSYRKFVMQKKVKAKIPQLIHHQHDHQRDNKIFQTITSTPSTQKISPTSSVISFGDDPAYERHKISEKCMSFFNAW